jgi:hypothetical protein
VRALAQFVLAGHMRTSPSSCRSSTQEATRECCPAVSHRLAGSNLQSPFTVVRWQTFLCLAWKYRIPDSEVIESEPQARYPRTLRIHGCIWVVRSTISRR